MFFEFQAKGCHTIQFELKVPDFNSITPNHILKPFKDGERIIAKLLDTKLGEKTFYKIEDIEGNVALVPATYFHKITDPKSFSKKFVYFKQQNHITD